MFSKMENLTSDLHICMLMSEAYLIIAHHLNTIHPRTVSHVQSCIYSTQPVLCAGIVGNFREQ